MNNRIMLFKRIIHIISSLIVASLIGAAIWEQVHLPSEERTWQGQILGIPYDFRWPTIKRIQEKVWNKNTSHVLTPHLFGIGWSINFYPLLHPKAEDSPT